MTTLLSFGFGRRHQTSPHHAGGGYDFDRELTVRDLERQGPTSASAGPGFSWCV